MLSKHRIIDLNVDVQPSISTSTSSLVSLQAMRQSLVYASVLACVVTKRAAALAYESKKRSMTSPDVIDFIGVAFDQL